MPEYYKDIEVIINFKPFAIKAILCDDGWAKIPFKSLPYHRAIPMLISTPFVKVVNDQAFERWLYDLSNIVRGKGIVEGSGQECNSNG